MLVRLPITWLQGPSFLTLDGLLIIFIISTIVIIITLAVSRAGDLLLSCGWQIACTCSSDACKVGRRPVAGLVRLVMLHGVNSTCSIPLVPAC